MRLPINNPILIAPRLSLCSTVLISIISCGPPGACPETYFNIDGSEANEMTVSVVSSGYDGTWNSITEEVSTIVAPASDNRIDFHIYHSTCYIARVHVVFELSSDNEIGLIRVLYFSPLTSACLSYQEVIAREIGTSCSIDVLTDWESETPTTNFSFHDCTLDLVDDCPMNASGECIDGPSVEQITINGTFQSEMERQPCR